MIHLLDNGKINFLVNVHYGYKECMTGAGVAMHHLAYLLAKEGHNVYIFCEPEYPHENIHTIKSWRTQRLFGAGVHSEEGEMRSWEGFCYQYSNTVAIYDQDNYGNWFGVHHKARWILYDSAPYIVEEWGDDDYYFNFGGYYKAPSKGIYGGDLTVVNYGFDVFKDYGGKREGYCHIWHKHTSENASKIVEKYNSVDVSDWKDGGHALLTEQFNKYEYFLTYDQKSFYTIAAALCGCTPIIVDPNTNENSYYRKDMTPIEFRIEDPAQLFGVAWGFEDLKWAKDTKHLVRDYLVEYDKQIQQKTVRDFIKFWEDKCNI